MLFVETDDEAYVYIKFVPYIKFSLIPNLRYIGFAYHQEVTLIMRKVWIWEPTGMYV